LAIGLPTVQRAHVALLFPAGAAAILLAPMDAASGGNRTVNGSFTAVEPVAGSTPSDLLGHICEVRGPHMPSEFDGDWLALALGQLDL
jgi:hypothetical protein